MLIRSRPWRNSKLPKKVLAIRLQALGDTIITLPYLQSIKKQTPDITLHFLTRKEVADIPLQINLFDRVFTIGGKRNVKLQTLSALLLLPVLLWQRYDMVIDLQNNKISKIIRFLINPKSWSEFDKDSEISAGVRTQETINATGVFNVKLETQFQFECPEALALLKNNGWDGDRNLIILNPAGFCPSRHWGIKAYCEFAKLWLRRTNGHSQFILLLLPSMKMQAEIIKEQLGDACIDLTGRANQKQAFKIISYSLLVLTEDSGLMHMAWVQGIPTLALFSSSSKNRSAPIGRNTFCLDSSDLECGPCFLEICQFGDNRCLTRYSPEFVVDKALQLTNGAKIQ